jgi:hypothetical protein
MRNTTLHSPRERRPSRSVWIADRHATESCISCEPIVNKDAPSSLSQQRAVIRRQRNRAAGAGGSGRPDVAEVVRLQSEVFHPLTATTCVPVRPGESGSCLERERRAVHAQSFARGIRSSTTSRDV